MAVNLFNAEAALVVLSLAVIAERLVQWFIRPIFDRQKWDTFYLMYVGLVFGGGLSLASNQDMFGDTVVPRWVGMVLTAIICGGGSNLLNQLTQRPAPAEVRVVFDAAIGDDDHEPTRARYPNTRRTADDRSGSVLMGVVTFRVAIEVLHENLCLPADVQIRAVQQISPLTLKVSVEGEQFPPGVHEVRPILHVGGGYTTWDFMLESEESAP